MNILFYITSIAFSLWIIRNALFWVYLWQLKEYRFDRVLVHLKETYQGKTLLFSPLNVIKILLIFFYGVTVFNPQALLFYQLGVATVFVIEAFLVLRESYNHLVKRPVFTVKAILLLLLTVGSVFLFAPLFLLEKYTWLLLLDRTVPFLVLLFVTVFSLPTEFYRDFQIGKAMNRLKKRKDILVIAVTGSYGKSSTKEYIAQILASKFSILKTLGTNNTPSGIAQTILKGLRRNTEIFIVEMGMYKRGEIAQMCQMVHPKIGVLTAVNEQHLSLSGNLASTMCGKYELMEALPKDGLAIFNGNNENSKKLYYAPPSCEGYQAKKTKGRNILFQWFQKKNEGSADISAYSIMSDKDSVSFTAQIGEKRMYLKAPLLGRQTIENILPGIYIADYLGMSPSEIKKAVFSLTPLPKTMIRQELRSGVSIIDDTFNSNPQAVFAAVSYAEAYDGKKIMVLQPMIELGRKGKDEHFKVGREISKTCDYLFLTNKNFYTSILKGIADGGGRCIVKVAKPGEIADFVNKKTTFGDVVLFEGKEAGFALERVL